MTQLIEWIKYLIGLAKPENLQAMVNLGGPPWVGYAVLTAIIFSETGLLVGFFLPGDSLLFSAGFLSSQGVFDIVILDVLLCLAAVIGDGVNYYFGLQMGEHVLKHGRLRFVKHSHLMAAKAFAKTWWQGNRTGSLRAAGATFTPFVAGVARMSYREFVVYNFVGGVAWVLSMSLAGYWFGQISWIQKNFELVVIGIVAISVLPVIIGVLRHWQSERAAARLSGRISL